jgi:hypothetical protein
MFKFLWLITYTTPWCCDVRDRLSIKLTAIWLLAALFRTVQELQLLFVFVVFLCVVLCISRRRRKKNVVWHRKWTVLPTSSSSVSGATSISRLTEPGSSLPCSHLTTHILKHTNPVLTLPPELLKIKFLILPFHLHLDLPSAVSSSGFLTFILVLLQFNKRYVEF